MGQRFGGRKIGTPNKDRDKILAMLQDAAFDLTGEVGFDPLRSMLKLADDPENKMGIKDRRDTYAILAEYTHAKRKAIVHSGHIDGEQTVNIYKWDEEDTSAIDRQIGLMDHPDEE